MTNILVLYYSSYGHIQTMAEAVAAGAKTAGAKVDLKRIPETVPNDIAQSNGYKIDQECEIATPEELANYDGIIFGSPTHFGNMSGQMRTFLDQTGGLWAEGKLIGKVGSVFNSTASQHGGQESMILSFHTTLLHQGMVVVGLPYSCKEQLTLDEISGGTPYGATTIAGADGSRQVSKNELKMAHFQGNHVAVISAKLAGKELLYQEK